MHESAACLVQGGKLLFACAEERLSGVKQDGRFLDLSTVRGVLWFSIVSALAPMPVYLADTWHALRGFEKRGVGDTA